MQPAAQPGPFIPPPLPAGPPPKASAGAGALQVLAGFGFGFFVPIALMIGVGNLVFEGIGGFPDDYGFILVFGMGIWQLAWVIPTSVVMWRRGKQGFVQGLITGASLVFLFSSACFGLWISFSGL